ncbi:MULTISPECIES: hypothetical protein [unclassified Mycobacterium]|uniref:hypothetical protein n=1 Tax=unclassified Mycobacterium TaxID=2642494 RepID=UPI0029C974DF|nr:MULTISPECIES: hypothetical protein [unclassified Mycobacterium]
MSDVEIAVKQIREAMEESPEAWVTAVESLCADAIKVSHDPPIADWGTTEEMEGGVDTARMFAVWRQELEAQRRAAPDYHLSQIDVGSTPEGGVYFANHHTGTMVSDGRVVSAPARVTTGPLENGKIVSWTVTTDETVAQLREWLAEGQMQLPEA